MKITKQLDLRRKEIIKDVGMCQNCKATWNLTLDHFIPVWILELMGFNKEEIWDEENFQVLCGKCNAMKGGRLDFTNPKTKYLLRKYLDLMEKNEHEKVEKVQNGFPELHKPVQEETQM